MDAPHAAYRLQSVHSTGEVAGHPAGRVAGARALSRTRGGAASYLDVHNASSSRRRVGSGPLCTFNCEIGWALDAGAVRLAEQYGAVVEP